MDSLQLDLWCRKPSRTI